MMERVFYVNEIMDLIAAPRRVKKIIVLDDGIDIKYNAKLRLFRKHYAESGVIKCDVCGIVGDIFVVRRNNSGKRDRYHVALINHKHDIEITRDHIEPLCQGGSIGLENQIPMCKICNNEWKSKFDEGRI